MKKLSVLLVGILLSMMSFSQTTLIGKVTDANTGEALIGATVIYGKGLGTATDFDGNYSISLHPVQAPLTFHSYDVQISSPCLSFINCFLVFALPFKTNYETDCKTRC